MVKKRKYGDAWRDVQIDAEQNDAVFDRFFKRTPLPPAAPDPEKHVEEPATTPAAGFFDSVSEVKIRHVSKSTPTVGPEPILSPASAPPVSAIFKNDTSSSSKPERTKSTVDKVNSNVGLVGTKGKLDQNPHQSHGDKPIAVGVDRVEELRQQYRLSKGEVAILKILMGDATVEQGRVIICYTKIPLLSVACDMTHRGCQFALKNLQERGLITKIKDYDPTDRLGIKFQINIPLA